MVYFAVRTKFKETMDNKVVILRLLPLLMLSGNKDGGTLTANLTDRIAVPMKISALFGGAARCRSVL